MPLKHDTETMMVFFLGLMIALAGVVSTFLPPVSVTIIPWAVAFVLSLVYPLALYPMMKERRADYEFRALHFVPALILVVWLALDLLVVFRPQWQILQTIFTWGWSLGVVGAAFVLLVIFCVRVIRQRLARVGLLLAVLLPFIILSQLSERFSWDRQLAMTLWDGAQTGTGLVAVGGSSSNLAPSSDGPEEQWRAELRRMEQRRQQLAQQGRSSIAISSAAVTGASSSMIIAANSAPSSTKSRSSASGEADDKQLTPPRLPSSGFGMEGVALVMAAGYCATLQRRWMRRSTRK